MPASPVRKKNPVGRPRKDGFPPGFFKKLKVAEAPALSIKSTASGAAVQSQKRPRGRPRKDGTMPGSKRIGEALASAPVSQPAPESSPLSSPLSLPSPSPSQPRHIPSQLNVGQSHKPIAGSFTHPATEDSYNTRIYSPSDTETEFDDATDKEDTDADDTGVNETIFGDPDTARRRFRLDYLRNRFVAKYSGIRTSDHERTKSRRDWDCGMFPNLEDEDEVPVGEEDRAQTEEERREASRQRQKRVCEAHGCYEQGCRINHVRRKKVEYFLQGLDERISQLSKPAEKGEEEAAAEARLDDSTVAKGGKRLVYLMETELCLESQFEPLFSSIMHGRRRDLI